MGHIYCINGTPWFKYFFSHIKNIHQVYNIIYLSTELIFRRNISGHQCHHQVHQKIIFIYTLRLSQVIYIVTYLFWLNFLKYQKLFWIFVSLFFYIRFGKLSQEPLMFVYTYLATFYYIHLGFIYHRVCLDTK